MLRVILLLGAFGVGNAQSLMDQEIARARALLQSQDWPAKAWGAYFAGRLQSKELRPLVSEQIRGAATLSAPAAYVDVLLDAAVELNLQLPAAEIEPLQARWPAAAMILLARSPDGEESLQRLADAKWFSLPWLAANNLLWQKKSARWYRGLLEEVSVTHTFVVLDPGSGAGVGVGFGCGTCASGGGQPDPQGYPPIVRYTLGLKAATGSVVVAAGPHTVYYSRTMATDCPDVLDIEAVREGYLGALADVSEKEVHARLQETTRVTYGGREGFLKAVEEALRAQEQQIREWIQRIDSGGLRTPEGLRVRIAVTITDLREDRGDALPSVAAREIAIGR
jgi:hypothetical protein